MLIAITDLETTGLDFAIHEIIDIGLLVVDSVTLQVTNKLDIRVKPTHLDTATEEAMRINGYNETDWKDAVSLEEAMKLYAEKTPTAIFLAHNVTFDWSFINEAFRSTKVKNLMDYHRLDLYTISWFLLKSTKIKGFNLNKIANFLGIPEEPMPHRAINGATTAYEVFKKLVVFEKRMRNEI